VNIYCTHHTRDAFPAFGEKSKIAGVG